MTHVPTYFTVCQREDAAFIDDREHATKDAARRAGERWLSNQTQNEDCSIYVIDDRGYEV